MDYSTMYFWVIVLVAIVCMFAFGPAPVVAFILIALGILGLYLAAAYLLTFGIPGWLAVSLALVAVVFAVGVAGQFYSNWRVNAVGDLESHRVKARDGDAKPNSLLLAILKLFHVIDL